MALDRKDNDDQMEKLRMEADDVAAKVSGVVGVRLNDTDCLT